MFCFTHLAPLIYTNKDSTKCIYSDKSRCIIILIIYCFLLTSDFPFCYVKFIQ